MDYLAREIFVVCRVIVKKKGNFVLSGYLVYKRVLWAIWRETGSWQRKRRTDSEGWCRWGGKPKPKRRLRRAIEG